MKVDLFLGLVVGLLLVMGAVHITAARKPSYTYPFGNKMFVGRYGRNAVSDLARPLDSSVVPDSAGTTGLEAFPSNGAASSQGSNSPSTSPGSENPTAALASQGGYGRTTYIRWGRKSCPTVDGTSDVYSGITAGSFYTHPGGGSNYICMVQDGKYQDGAVTTGGSPTYIYGTEYETISRSLNDLHDNNVPCAACLATRATQLMIPGTTDCPEGWTTEYTGWLMSAYYGHTARTEFVCVDKDAEPLAGGVPNNDGALMYHVTVACSTPGIPCPPYVNSMDLACAVCTT